MTMLYAYCRVSTKKQDIRRQEMNITARYAVPHDNIIREVYTGKEMMRPEWIRLRQKLKSGDTVVFDSVSRMSRNADEGITDYMALFNKGINLIFINEPHICTQKYYEAIQNAEQHKINLNVKTGDKMIDELLDFIQNWINQFLLYIISRDIKAEFEKAESEIENLSQRTIDGMKAKNAGNKISQARKNKKYRTIESLRNRIIILERSSKFSGSLNNSDLSKILGISTRTVSRYAAEMMDKLSKITINELKEKLRKEIKDKQKNKN